MNRPARPAGRGERGQATLEYVALLVLVLVCFGLAAWRGALTGIGGDVVAAFGRALAGSDDADRQARTRSELDLALRGGGLSLPLVVRRAGVGLGADADRLVRDEVRLHLPSEVASELAVTRTSASVPTGGRDDVRREGFGFHIISVEDEASQRGLYDTSLHLPEIAAFAGTVAIDAAGGKLIRLAGGAVARHAGGHASSVLGRLRGTRVAKLAVEGVGGSAASVGGKLLRPLLGEAGVATERDPSSPGRDAAKALAEFASASNEDLPPLGAQTGDVIVCTTERSLHVSLDRSTKGPGRIVAVGFRPGVAGYASGTLTDPSLCRPE